MVSFRTGAPRAPSAQASRADASGSEAPITGGVRAGGAGDAAIRLEFEMLAGRIRILQQRAAREAAALACR